VRCVQSLVGGESSWRHDDGRVVVLTDGGGAAVDSGEELSYPVPR
jgi:hypothetical protein